MPRITRRVFSARIVTGAVAAFAATAVGPSQLARGHDGPHNDEASAADAAGPTEHLVEIGGFEFQPSRLSVHPGDTVTWVNNDIAPHTATADDNSWDTGAIRTNERVSLPVTQDMVLAYYCRFHPVMTGRLEMAVDG